MGDMRNVPMLKLNDDTLMPQLGLGTYKLTDDECVTVVRQAIELGYRRFDTASMYGNEEALGKALREAFAAGDVARDDVFVTTKLWNDQQGADHVDAAFGESMKRLGLDYIDLYLIHWPWPQGGLYNETFEAIARLQGMGQIASIGVANFYEDVLKDLISTTGISPVLNQVEIHPGFTQSGLRAFHHDNDIVTEAWAPLARGVVLNNPEIEHIAADHEATEGQVVLAYLMSKGMSVIPKSARTERLKENLAATELELTAEEVSAIDALEGQEGFGRMFNDPREFPGNEG